jgi:hypothetical protein
MKSISQIGVISSVMALLVWTSHAPAQNSQCSELPNGNFELGLDGWIIEPVAIQTGNASAFYKSSVVDGAAYGKQMNGQVLLLQATANAVGLPDAPEGSSFASTDLVVKSPQLIVINRYLIFAVGGGYELISFGMAHSNMDAQIEISSLAQKQMQHQLGQLAFPPFQSCEWGISILGTFQQDKPVVIDLLVRDGQSTGISLGDSIDLTITLHCSSFAANECDDALIFGVLALDDFKFCPVPPGTSLGDATGDGIVDVDDLLVIINAWGACSSPPEPCPADFTGNLIVDVDDLLAAINNWS